VNVVTMPAITVQAAAPSVTTVAGTVTIGSCVTHGVNVANTVTISSLPAISGTVTANLNETNFYDVLSYYSSEGAGLPVRSDGIFPISGTVTVGSCVTHGVNVANSVTIGSLPVQLSTTTIGGTARLNVTLSSATTIGATVPSYGNLYGGSDGTSLRAILVDSSGRTTVTGSVSVANTVPVSGTFWQATQPVSGTVTANISGTSTVTGSVSILGTPSVTMGAIFGAVTMYGSNVNGGIVIPSLSSFDETPNNRSGYALLVKIMDDAGLQNVPLTNTQLRITAVTIAGTVTANNPNGVLTTRFGSVTTANTAQITTAVTNTSRKYLLAQNISTGTVTIGIGFNPTTTQGIQLTAGAGLTFDSFVPTGAVYWLGATTGAAYTILEG
jgi:hypothetical protein